MDNFILPHLDEMQHEDERTDTPYFAIALASVTLRAEAVSLDFFVPFFCFSFLLSLEAAQ